MEQEAEVVAALESARAQLYRGATLLTAAVFAEDAVPFIDSYRQAQVDGDKSMERARSTLAEIGKTDQIAALGSFAKQMGQLREDIDAVLVFSVAADRPTRVEVGLQYYPQMWPRVDAMMGDLGTLSGETQAEFEAADAAADRASNITLALLIGFTAVAFLGSAATLIVLIVSIVQPLASLQVSARAVASGDLDARAKVAGPEEVASLARDFNEMTDTLIGRSALLEESEGRFRSVLEVSRDLLYKLNLQTRTYDYVSPSSLRLVGFAPQEIVAMGLEGVIERFHPDDRERLGTHPSRLPDDTVEGRNAPTIEYRWQCKDGEYRWLSDNRAFVFDEGGRALALVGTVRDITKAMAAAEDKRKAYESIIFLLATAAEARDPYTEDHLPRIKGYAEAMAAELGLSPGEIREIGLCSLLHDLGKMRVPDSILTKPGPLSGAEWKIMRQHPAWGEELLSTHPWLGTARQIARCHHESWDGGGYPDGLRGEEIPLCAAIVAVADGFDAMLSDRPYRKAWPSHRAVAEVRAQKGRQYSPDVVEAFNRALRKGEIGRITSADSARLPEMSEAA
jgi:PAS domain S-box-containing protein